MNRRIVSEEELVGILNTELSKYDECKKCKFDFINKLAEPDKSGSNWYSANMRSGGGASAFCRQVADRVVSEARKQMNIA